METLETLGKRIAATEDLQSIVRTMKSLSAVSIRQYESAVAALSQYSRTIDLGLEVVLEHEPTLLPGASEPQGPTLAIVFGSDHGLCGRFNDQIARFASEHICDLGVPPYHTVWLAVGIRAGRRLEFQKKRVDECFFLPSTVTGLTGMAQSILIKVDEYRTTKGIERVLLLYNYRSEEATASPRKNQLLPLDSSWLRQLAERPWPSRRLPTFTMNVSELFSSLIRQHLFIAIFRAGAESLASEHATRLVSMQAAEKNIGERLEEMKAAYRHNRQESITQELLDIIGGFETLSRGN